MEESVEDFWGSRQKRGKFDRLIDSVSAQKDKLAVCDLLNQLFGQRSRSIRNENNDDEEEKRNGSP